MKLRREIVAAALGGASLTAAGAAKADESWSYETLKPAQSMIVEAGRKRIVGSFQTVEGVCELTLTIYDVQGADAAQATRLEFAVEPGRQARFDASDGKSLRYACLGRAQSMSVSTLDHVALHGAR